MNLAWNMPAATDRHLHDGDLLKDAERWDNAGYHYGIAAECALKGAMQRIGVKLREWEVGGADSYYLHFPDLCNLALEHTGRISVTVAQRLQNRSFMQFWTIKMRYTGKVVSKEQCLKWRDQAHAFVSECKGI